MKVGIIGLPQVGKKTLFSLLTGEPLDENAFSGKEEIKYGMASIRDTRFDRLASMYNPQKSVPALLEVVLLPKFDKETISSGECLKAVEKCDALCHIVRAFENETVFHVEGSVDPLRDIDSVFTELILSDLILVEKRLERISKELRIKPGPQQAREKELLEGMKKMLDENAPLINFKMNEEEKKIMSTYQLVTRRPLIVVLNVSDNKLSDEILINQVTQKYNEYGIKVMQVSAKIEAELLSLDPQERDAFLSDLNIEESALNLLSRLCFEALGLMSFFTVGEDEVRQWTAKKGSTAPEAAGSIHSDLQRGFIRAEIMKYDDLIEHGSELKLKEVGKLYLKGKDYTVEDGDIMHVRFNV